jgi:hypothetical protein
VALVLIGAVADFAESVEEYGAAERILLLTLVEADVAATAQLGVLQPLERKESPFQLSQFAQRERQAVLAGAGPQDRRDPRYRTDPLGPLGQVRRAVLNVLLN